MTEDIRPEDALPSQKRPFSRRRALSAFLNLVVVDITGKLTGVVLFVGLTVALIVDPGAIERITGLVFWQQAACLLLLAWALWFWFMTDRDE